MIRILLLGLFITISQSIASQSYDTLGHWIIKVNFGVEANDKRFFDYSEKEALLSSQQDFFGTYHMGIDLNRMFFQNINLTGYFGVGLNFEQATLSRPFDHRYFGTDFDEVLRTQDSYKKIKIPLSSTVFYSHSNRVCFSAGLGYSFVVKRKIDNSKSFSDVFPYEENSFHGEGFNLNLGVTYRLGNLLFGLESRVIHLQQIDKIIFNSLIKDPRTNQKWEWTNSLRLDLTFAYIL